MKFQKAYLQAFGKFIDASFSFSSGINLVYGSNESGKSTLGEFIFSMLYGQKKYGVKKRMYLSSYDLNCPWHHSLYKGILQYSLDNNNYRVERNYHTDFEEVKVFKENTGEEITFEFTLDVRKELQFLVEQIGLNERCFKNTVFVEQNEMAGLLHQNKEDVLEELLGKVIYGIELEQTEKTVREVIKELERKKREIGTIKSKNKPLGNAYQKLREKSEARYRLDNEKESYYANQQALSKLIEKEECLEEKEKELQTQKRYLEKQSIQKKIKIIDDLMKEQKELENYIDRNFPYEIRQNSVENTYKERKKVAKKSKAILSFAFIMLSLGIVFALWIAISSKLWIQLPLMLLSLIAGIWGLAKWKYSGRKEENLIAQLEKENQYEDAAKELQRLRQRLEGETSEYSLHELKKKLTALEIGESIFVSDMKISQYDIELESEKIKKQRFEMMSEKALLEVKIQESNWDSIELEQIERDIYQLEKDIEDMEDNIQAIETAIYTLATIEGDEKSKWLPQLIRKTEENIYKITKKYHTIKIDDKYQIKTLEPSTQKLINIDQLSQGTFYQFYFALRLSLIQLLSPTPIRLPIILDEPFTHFDDERFEESMELLKELSKEQQIILFTSQKREKKYMDQSDSSYHYIDLNDK